MTDHNRQQLTHIRDQFVNHLITGFTLLASVGAPLSLSRMHQTGLQPSMVLHIILSACLILLFIFRYKINVHIKACALIAMATIVGLAGLFDWGLMGNGLMWLIIAAFLAACLYSVRVGTIFIALLVTCCSYTAYLYLSGSHHLPIDADLYLKNPAAWGAAIIGSLGFAWLIMFALSHMRASTEQLLEQIQAQKKQIAHYANHDHLTDLPALRLAEDRLEMALKHAERYKKKVGVLFMDLNRFKPINDQYGHKTGDEVLKVVADRLLHSARDCDTVARIGGDEFLLIASDISFEKDLSIIGNRITDAIAEPVEIGEHRFNIGISIGVAVYPEHGDNPISLTTRADQAMYRAKRHHNEDIAFACTELAI